MPNGSRGAPSPAFASLDRRLRDGMSSLNPSRVVSRTGRWEEFRIEVIVELPMRMGSVQLVMLIAEEILSATQLPDLS